MSFVFASRLSPAYAEDRSGHRASRRQDCDDLAFTAHWMVATYRLTPALRSNFRAMTRRGVYGLTYRLKQLVESFEG